MFTGAWRSSQKPRWRVVARARSYDHQILRPSRSVDDKAVLAARVRVPGAIVRAWWRVQLPLVVGFLGFGHDMP